MGGSFALERICRVLCWVQVLADAEMQSNAATESYRVATLWTSYFWQELLKRFASAKTQEIRFQDLLANLVTDVLAVHNQPEWPAAHLLLQVSAESGATPGTQAVNEVWNRRKRWRWLRRPAGPLSK